MEQPIKSQSENNQPVIGAQCSRPSPVIGAQCSRPIPIPIIGAQCSRPEVIPGKTYTRANYPGETLSRSFESYTKEPACGRKEEKKEETTSCCFSEGIKTNDFVNKIIKEKSDSNLPFIKNSKELASCKTVEQTINVLTGFMQSGLNDFEKKTGRRPTYSEMREMYG